jgi:hypothetical protein
MKPSIFSHLRLNVAYNPEKPGVSCGSAILVFDLKWIMRNKQDFEQHLRTLYSMIKFFPLAILALLIFKALHIRDVTLQSLSECLLPGRISLISLVFTPFEICQDKKT